MMPNEKFTALFRFIRHCYPNLDRIPLHEPISGELEKQYLSTCIDSNFFSSVGPSVSTFEDQLCQINQCEYCVATVNGTAALHLGLLAVGVTPESEVITQALTFIATANAIRYCNAHPVFVDINRETLGLSPDALRDWLSNNTDIVDGLCTNKKSGRVIKACVCMHTLGHPVQLKELKALCDEFHIALVEDAAEALGSQYESNPVGSFADCGIYSFNGNKVITTGGGGAILTNDKHLATKVKHLSTTAKMNFPGEFRHDQVAYNYRMPSLNAALGCAQLERLPAILVGKRNLAAAYAKFFSDSPFEWINEPVNCRSNYWLNSILCKDKSERDALLNAANESHIEMRPAWQLLSDSLPYANAERGNLSISIDIANRIVNLPSSANGLKTMTQDIQ